KYGSRTCRPCDRAPPAGSRLRDRHASVVPPCLARSQAQSCAKLRLVWWPSNLLPPFGRPFSSREQTGVESIEAEGACPICIPTGTSEHRHGVADEKVRCGQNCAQTGHFFTHRQVST